MADGPMADAIVVGRPKVRKRLGTCTRPVIVCIHLESVLKYQSHRGIGVFIHVRRFVLSVLCGSIFVPGEKTNVLSTGSV